MDNSDIVADALEEVLKKHTWTGLRSVLLGDYNGVIRATGAPYPRSVNWHSSIFQARESGTAVLPGNSEIRYEENPVYAVNPPPITIGYPEGSYIYTVKGISSSVDGAFAQGEVSQSEQKDWALQNPSVLNIVDLRVDSLGAGHSVLVNAGAYLRDSVPNIIQYIEASTSVDLTTQIAALTGIQHQLACIYLDRETGLFGVATSTAIDASRGFVPSYSTLDLPSVAQSITLTSTQKPLGYVYLYSGQVDILGASIFTDLDPRFVPYELSAYLTSTGGAITGRLTLQSGLNLPVRVVIAAGAITLTNSDYIVLANKTVGAATVVNLPPAPVKGDTYCVKDGKGDASTNNLTLTPAAGTIDGASTYVISTNYGFVLFVYNGTEWSII